MRLTRTRFAFALLIATTASAHPAQAQDKGSFGVRAPIVTVVANPPHGLPGAVISNTTQQTLDVKVFPSLLGQSLDGTLDSLERPDQLGAALRLLSVSPKQFTLAPNTEQRVSARWLDTLPEAKAAYLGIVFSGNVRRAAAGGVTFNPRLVQINRLRRPGPYVSRGKFTNLRGEQAGPQKLRFLADVRNLGQVAEKPARTSFVIHDADGNDVFRTRWGNTKILVLPGSTVEFPIDVTKVLPAGRYTAQALMRFGRNPALEKIETPFELAGPNLLPTPGLKLGDLGTGGEPGGPAKITVPVKSTGTAPTGGRLSVELFTLGGTKPIATAKASTRVLKPKEVQDVKVELGHVEVGNYRVEVVLTDEKGRQLDRASKGFRISAAKSFLDRYKGVVIGLGGLALLLGLLLFLRRQRRRRKQLEAELEAARAGAPAAAPVAAATVGVDLNAAGQAELQSVPGIGPAAAQRIIEYREAHGPFASVDGLIAVSGIGAQKVEALRPYLRV